MLEPNLHRWNGEVVECTIFKPLLIGLQVKSRSCILRGENGSKDDRPTSKPGTLQFRQSVFAGEQAACTGGIAKDFIKRERDKVRMPSGEIQAIGGCEGGAIDKDIPAPCMSFFNPF